MNDWTIEMFYVCAGGGNSKERPRIIYTAKDVDPSVTHFWQNWGKAGWARFDRVYSRHTGEPIDSNFELVSVTQEGPSEPSQDHCPILSGSCALTPLRTSFERLTEWRMLGLGFPWQNALPTNLGTRDES